MQAAQAVSGLRKASAALGSKGDELLTKLEQTLEAVREAASSLDEDA